MNVTYVQWHDGLGYDLKALDGVSGRERDLVEADLVKRATADWRDLEALDRLGTVRAIEAILAARSAENPEIRLYAHRYGPAPTVLEWEAAIVYGLRTCRSFEEGLMLVIRSAIEHPSPGVLDALWSIVRTPRAEGCYQAAEALCAIAGVDVDQSFFLRFVGPQRPDRDLAIRELEGLVGRPGF